MTKAPIFLKEEIAPFFFQEKTGKNFERKIRRIF